MIAVFAFSDKIKAELKDLLADEAIRDYRDDINRQNIIDWFQETVSVSLTRSRSCGYSNTCHMVPVNSKSKHRSHGIESVFMQL